MQKMSAQAQLFHDTPKNYYVILHRVIVSSLVLLLSCTAASGQQAPYKPLISRLAIDPNTSLYTITIKADKSPLLLDLAGSLVWSTCQPSSAQNTVGCRSGSCGGAASQQCPRRCLHVDGGRLGESGSSCACAGNPVSRQCSTGGLTSFAMTANATDGAMELPPEEPFAVQGACAPAGLLRSLPAGVTGVAGFSRRPLSLPSQLAAQRGLGGKFALCLPVFAIFGESPVNLTSPWGQSGYADYRTIIASTPLLTNPENPAGYYIPVKGISVSWHGDSAQAILPSAAVLDLNVATGTGGVVLSTATPYMIMRRDVFDAFAVAFHDAITRGKFPMTTMERVVPAPEPFKLCYRGVFPLLKRPVSLDLPSIHMELGAGATRNWTLFNDNYMVQTDRGLCLAILPSGPGGMPVDGEPAVVIGAKQLQNNLLVFDVEKQVLGFSMLLDFSLSSCTSSQFFRN